MLYTQIRPCSEAAREAPPLDESDAAQVLARDMGRAARASLEKLIRDASGGKLGVDDFPATTYCNF